MAKIKQMSQNNENIYPVTHEDAVFDSDGVSIGTKIDNIEADMLDLVDIGEIEDVDDNIIERLEEIEMLIKDDYVTPEMFGAKGDGITDDTEAFTRAFNSGQPIRCIKNKIYYFKGVINARNITDNTFFDGNYAKFLNFKLEISLKDEEYDWRKPYSPNILEIINCDFGMNNEKEQSYFTPVVISGMAVCMKNINLYKRLVLLAYPDRYIDVLRLVNITKVYDELPPEGNYNYNAIMRILPNGELVEHSTNGVGDSWVFDGCNEFYFNDSFTDLETGNVIRYNLVTLFQNRVSINNCIQSNIKISRQSIVNFNNCHWEDSYPYFNEEELLNTQITFNGCYFYGQAIPDVNKNLSFIDCFFRFGYGEKQSYTYGKSLLKNANVINCRFGDAGNISCSTDLLMDIGCNYKGDDLEEFGNSNIKIYEGGVTTGSFVGETKVTLYGKRLEADYYYFKSSETFTLDGTNIICITSTCNTPAIYDFYIENNGIIYKGCVKTNDSIHTIEFHIFNNHFRASVNYRGEKIQKCYPNADTLEVVEAIPDYIECLTLYRISKGLCIDTSESPVNNVPRFATIASNLVNPGNMW